MLLGLDGVGDCLDNSWRLLHLGWMILLFCCGFLWI